MRHFRSLNFRHVIYNCGLKVNIFTLKWGKDDKSATRSFMYISEAINKVLTKKKQKQKKKKN